MDQNKRPTSVTIIAWMCILVIPLSLVGSSLFAAVTVPASHYSWQQQLPEFIGAFHWNVAAVSLTAVATGLGLAWLIYQQRVLRAQQLVEALALPVSLVQRHFYFDALYAWYVERIQQRVVAGACALFERFIIIGAMVRGTAGATRLAGHLMRFCQTGKIQTYVLVFLTGVVWMLYTTLQ